MQKQVFKKLFQDYLEDTIPEPEITEDGRNDTSNIKQIESSLKENYAVNELIWLKSPENVNFFGKTTIDC